MANAFADPFFRTLGQPDSPWHLKVHEGIKASADVSGGVMTIPMKWTQGTNWHVEMIYGPFEVKKGQQYAIGLDATALQPFRFSVWLGQYNDPYQSLVAENNHFGEDTLQRDWTFYKHRWMVIQDEPQARVAIAIGRIDTTVRIRNPRLKLLDA